MGETRKLAAILVADVVGYSRLAGADEERTLVRLRGLRSDLIDPAIAAHHGRIVKRTGDGALSSFGAWSTPCVAPSKSRTASSSATPASTRTPHRVSHWHPSRRRRRGVGRRPDGRRRQYCCAAEGIAKPSEVCLSEDAYWQVREKLKYGFVNLGPNSSRTSRDRSASTRSSPA